MAAVGALALGREGDGDEGEGGQCAGGENADGEPGTDEVGGDGEPGGGAGGHIREDQQLSAARGFGGVGEGHGKARRENVKARESNVATGCRRAMRLVVVSGGEVRRV